MTGKKPVHTGAGIEHHGLTEQAPRKVFVLTTAEASVPRRRGATARHGRDGFPVAGASYRFVQVKADRFFGTEKCGSARRG
jgi:predicted transcriptional regulator of viral defense system